MNDTTTNEIKELFGILPDILQKHIANSPWLQNIESIGNKYTLNEMQTEGLRQETLFVLMGMQPLSNFRANLVQELDLTYDQALKISFDANAQIFGPVMNELRQVQEGKIETTTSTPPTPTPVPVQPEPVNPFIPNPSKTGVVKNNSGMNPDHLLMDHKETERVDGVHLHSQNVMPSFSQPKGSIVDQKLSRIFRPSAGPTKPQKPYNGSDPYREPLE